MNLMERFRRQFAFNWGVGTIEFGAGKVAQLGPLAKAMKARNLLVVTDKAIAKTDILGKVEDSLKGAKVSYTVSARWSPTC
jgi:alcohol dehydrogenase class IV